MNDTEINLQSGKQVEYDRGEYVIKISDFEFMRLNDMRIGNYEIEVIQWGEKAESDLKELFFENVSKIHEPEPDKIIVHYTNGKFTTIPEWLFSKKVSNKRSSKFESCSEIKEIPENLFQNCINLERIESVLATLQLQELDKKRSEIKISHESVRNFIDSFNHDDYSYLKFIIQ